MTFAWSDWSIYVVSYLTSDGTPPANGRLERLTETLNEMGMAATVCAGPNALSEGRPQSEKVWLTHTAAIRRHVNGENAGNNCLVLEDDCEFLTDKQELNKRIVRMLKRKPAFDLINLGAFPLGLTVPIGGGLAVCQSPLLTHSVVYSPAFCARFAADGDLLAAPDYGEGFHKMPYAKRLIADPPLTTQSVWPRSTVTLMNTAPSFRELHCGSYKFLVYGVPALTLASMLGVAGGAYLNARGARVAGRTTIALSLLVFLIMFAVILVPNLGLNYGVAANPANHAVMELVAADDGFLADYCP